MPRKKTHEEYIEEVANINPDIMIIGEYLGTHIKILHKCKVCGYEWMAFPSNIISGYKCPVCSKKKKKTQDEYILEVNKMNKNIEVVGTYINNKTKILHRCKLDGCEWYASPSSIVNGGCGCPRCSNNERYGHEEYIKRVAKINPSIEIVGEYVNSKTKILHRCKLDGCEWYASPNKILAGRGCPECNISKGEKMIEDWFDKNNILYESQKKFEDCVNIFPLSFDFYLPNHNILIEYNGIQHYKPVDYFGGQKVFENQVLRDNIKKDYCQKNNILLIEIPYYSDLDEELIKLYDLINIKKKEVVA